MATTGRQELSRLNNEPATTAVATSTVMPVEIKGASLPLNISAAKLTLEIKVTTPAMVPARRMAVTVSALSSRNAATGLANRRRACIIYFSPRTMVEDSVPSIILS